MKHFGGTFDASNNLAQNQLVEAWTPQTPRIFSWNSYESKINMGTTTHICKIIGLLEPSRGKAVPVNKELLTVI